MLPLGYYDFPRCARAFCTGQKDARPVTIGGSIYRLRGRSKLAYTLVSFADAREAWQQLGELKRAGNKIRCLNYTAPPLDVPTRRADIEWVVPNFDIWWKGLKGRRINKPEALSITINRLPSKLEVLDIFSRWKDWAITRKFMVFTGHYLAWVDDYFKDSTSLSLISLTAPVGAAIFGWEQIGGQSQVVLAKHTSGFPARLLWTRGIYEIGAGSILCGTTADRLKEDMKFTACPSWTFDLRKL